MVLVTCAVGYLVEYLQVEHFLHEWLEVVRSASHELLRVEGDLALLLSELKCVSVVTCTKINNILIIKF